MKTTGTMGGGVKGEHPHCSNVHTGYFRKVHRSLLVWVPHNILNYLSIQKLPQMRSHQSIYLSNSHKKISILCFNFINNINIQSVSYNLTDIQFANALDLGKVL